MSEPGTGPSIDELYAGMSTKANLTDGKLDPDEAPMHTIIETRTDDPVSPVDGRLWLRTDLP